MVVDPGIVGDSVAGSNNRIAGQLGENCDARRRRKCAKAALQVMQGHWKDLSTPIPYFGIALLVSFAGRIDGFRAKYLASLLGEEK